MKKTMVILANYADAEGSYGLLGPQMAATIIQNNTNYECLVIGIDHDFDREVIKNNVLNITSGERQIVGFSNLGGRPDLYELAKELKAEGVITILGGPQAYVDYLGEVGWEKYPHRFHGFRNNFSLALQGPAEQLIPLLNMQNMERIDELHESSFIANGKRQADNQYRWNENFLRKINWQNLYRIGPSGLKSVSLTSAQVVQQIGCPYAARTAITGIDYPTNLKDSLFKKKGEITFSIRGCSFCDVARDKALGSTLSLEGVLAQITNLPEDEEGVKIPFELINEMPLPTLTELLSVIKQQGIRVSQVNLVTRADWLIKGKENLRSALKLAEAMNVRILSSAVGFESFSNSILKNLNKGYLVDTNLSAVDFMRQLKDEFPRNWFYSNGDGASHGFIHPTPWDSTDTKREMNTIISVYGLNRDILPGVSIPLIIHHACGLGDWVRELESRENIKLKRQGSIIEWW